MHSYFDGQAFSQNIYEAIIQQLALSSVHVPHELILLQLWIFKVHMIFTVVL